MDRKIGKFFHSIGNCFYSGEEIPWSDSDVIDSCEVMVDEAEKRSSDELKSRCMMHLSWALVHSTSPEDVDRGIAMLEADPDDSLIFPLERLYLLALGYFRNGDFSKSRQLVEDCLEMVPEYRDALTLKKAIEDRGIKGGVISIGIAVAVTAVGFVGALLFSRKK